MASMLRALLPSKRIGRACLSSWMASALSATWLSLRTCLSFAWAWSHWWLLRATWRPAGLFYFTFLLSLILQMCSFKDCHVWFIYFLPPQVWTSRLPSICACVLLWWPFPRVPGSSRSPASGVKGQGDFRNVGSASSNARPWAEP